MIKGIKDLGFFLDFGKYIYTIMEEHWPAIILIIRRVLCRFNVINRFENLLIDGLLEERHIWILYLQVDRMPRIRRHCINRNNIMSIRSIHNFEAAKTLQSYYIIAIREVCINSEKIIYDIYISKKLIRYLKENKEWLF